VLIRGASGRGKSSLALELMGYGATLVSDDQTVLARKNDYVFASAPPPIAGLIEARGLGVLRADYVDGARVVMVMDLDHETSDRIPEPRNVTILGCAVPLFYKPVGLHSAAGIIQYLRMGLSDK
jgi:HPr kinase/phosphorylase